MRWKAGAWRLTVAAGKDPATGKRRQVHRTVRAPNDAEGRRDAEWALAELLDEVDHPGFAAWRRSVEAAAERRAAEKVAEVAEWYKAKLAKATEGARHRVARLTATDPAGGFNPTGCFVYILWGDDRRRPLYVGQSTNVLARLGSHMADPEKREAIRRVELVRCGDAAGMTETEADLIRHHQPTWNVHGKLVRPA